MAEDKTTKKLKDPLYGYIEIPVEYATKIIDTAEFQRLRRIMQTSYSPLYSSAIHNRFVHSIGVFYLGGIVSKRLLEECVKNKFIEEEKMKELVRVYQLACLLHDVGHAPFSHTGECFYKTDDFKSNGLHTRIGELVGIESFEKELKSRNVTPTAPHELMSVIVGLAKYGEIIGDANSKEFFARCITGYTYVKNLRKREVQIKNCLIGLLNSKVIDVDRLDYLIRDAYITGYDTVNIDYNRLLNAVTVVDTDNGYQVAYKKDALSIIENVVYAHDAEKKWIQNHPVVLYEAYIIKHIIMHLNAELNGEGTRLFSEEALGVNGVLLKDGTKVSLLCDDDIVYLLKNRYSDELSKELFHRNKRRHPIWKSEAEYRGYVKKLSSGGDLSEEFDLVIEGITKGKFTDIPAFDAINKEYIEKLKRDLENAKAVRASMGGKNSDRKIRSLDSNINGIKQRLFFCQTLASYAESHNMECDFVVLSTDIFNSNFSKDYLSETIIVFKDGDKDVSFTLGQVCPPLKSSKERGKMFYVFYRNKESESSLRPSRIGELCKSLFSCTSAV